MPISRRLSCIALLCALAVFFVPRKALAREFDVTRVDMDATIQTDGTVSIVDTRQYEFDGDFNGIYWDVPRGTYNGRELNTHIQSVAASVDGEQTTFTEDSSNAPGTYEVTQYDSYYQLKLFWPASDQTVLFTVTYDVLNLASRWADVSELYWQFVPKDEDSEGEWQNVTCTVHLPVPNGEPVNAGQNVRAWGHGPLDATVSFDGDDVVFFAPGVGSSEYLEARVAFPASWLKDATASTESRLDQILSEEQQWADEANAKRTRARVIVWGSIIAMAVISAGSVVFCILRRHAYRKANKPQFIDTYYRDVPTNDHPALLGALYRGGTPASEDFSASLMRLADNGIIQLDLVSYEVKGLFGKKKTKEDYRLLERGRVESGLRGEAIAASCDRIDRATHKFLFETIAGHHVLDDSMLGPEGERYVLMSYFEDVARRKPSTYENGYNNWKSAIDASMKARKFTEAENSMGAGLPVTLAAIDIILSIALGFLGLFLGINVLLIVLLSGVLFGAGLFCAFTASKTSQGLSREAIEIKAQLKALRRWLKDFTKLDEAIPQDVVLWNRLLVMATVLGVAQEVISQLEVAVPQLLKDPCFYSYGWYYYGHHGMACPAHVASSSFGQAHSVSSAKLADTSSSSGGGGGGGFSGGGGGGFSGGGRGGAF